MNDLLAVLYPYLQPVLFRIMLLCLRACAAMRMGNLHAANHAYAVNRVYGGLDSFKQFFENHPDFRRYYGK